VEIPPRQLIVRQLLLAELMVSVVLIEAVRPIMLERIVRVL
jgi:hypothetical protein